MVTTNTPRILTDLGTLLADYLHTTPPDDNPTASPDRAGYQHRHCLYAQPATTTGHPAITISPGGGQDRHAGQVEYIDRMVWESVRELTAAYRASKATQAGPPPLTGVDGQQVFVDWIEATLVAPLGIDPAISPAGVSVSVDVQFAPSGQVRIVITRRGEAVDQTHQECEWECVLSREQTEQVFTWATADWFAQNASVFTR